MKKAFFPSKETIIHYLSDEFMTLCGESSNDDPLIEIKGVTIDCPHCRYVYNNTYNKLKAE